MDRAITERAGVLARAVSNLVEHATHALQQLRARVRPGATALATTVPVSAVMLSRVATVRADEPLGEAAQLLVVTRNGYLPVVDPASGTPLGVVTRDDVAVALARSGAHAPVSAAPLRDVITVAPSESLASVLARLRRHVREAVAIVMDRGAPVGLLTVDRLVAYVEGTTDAEPDPSRSPWPSRSIP